MLIYLNEVANILPIDLVPTGKDPSRVWWAVHLHNVWLSYQWWLLPWCQSCPQAEICAGANAVSQCCWWCLFPVSWWVPDFLYNLTLLALLIWWHGEWESNQRRRKNYLNSLFLCSHSSGGSEAESQPGAAHNLSRRPYWFPWGPVASKEHLHGPSLQAVC